MWLGTMVVVATWLGAQPPDAAARELARQAGTWRVVSFEREGTITPAEVTRSIVRVVEGDHVVWKRDGKSFAGTTIVLDPSKRPAAIDVIPDGGRSRGERVLGIYTFEGDELVICMADAGKPRPERFASPSGGKLTLMRFQKAAGN